MGPVVPPRRRTRAHPPLAGDDAAASTLVSFLVAVGLFVVAFSIVTVVLSGYVGHAASGTSNLDPVAQDALQVLTSSPGAPSDWCHATGHPQRAGLLKPGAQATVDLCKLRALSRGNVSYDALRASLGLHHREIHLRTYPAYVLAQNGSAPSLAGYRVLYVGHRGSGGSADPAPAPEGAALAATGAAFHDILYAAGDGTGNGGSRLLDSPADLSRYLGVRLLGFPGAEDGNTSLLPSGTTDTYWRVVPTANGSAAGTLDPDYPYVLTTSTYDGSQWSYAQGTDDRVVLARLDLRGVDPNATVELHLSEYVQGAPNGLGRKDSGSIEVRAANGTTWTTVWTGIHDLGSPGSFRTRAYELNGTAGKDVYVALRWTTQLHVNNRLSDGWFVADPSVTVTANGTTTEVWSNPMDLSRTSVDALVVGSDVNGAALEGAYGDLGPLVRAWILHGGDLVALGSDQLDTSWIPTNVTGGPGPNGPLYTDRSDLAHPLLTTPNVLDYIGWPTAHTSYGVPAKGWTRVLLTDRQDPRPILSVSDLTPGIKGTMVLSSHQPYHMSSDDRVAFFQNSLLYARFHELYLDYGPSEIPGVPVGSATYRGLVDATPLGLQYQDFNVILYVWGGS